MTGWSFSTSSASLDPLPLFYSRSRFFVRRSRDGLMRGWRSAGWVAFRSRCIILRRHFSDFLLREVFTVLALFFAIAPIVQQMLVHDGAARGDFLEIQRAVQIWPLDPHVRHVMTEWVLTMPTQPDQANAALVWYAKFDPYSPILKALREKNASR